MPITTCIFDAYGTLFDVGSAARAAAREPGREALADCWQDVAEDWRQKQLQYTWLRAITGDHCPFWQVTQDGLDWALENRGLDGDDELRDRLLALYRELDAYPEVPGMLRALKASGHTCAILSNGSPDMLDSSVAAAGLGGSLDAVLSVEEVGVFKPAAAVYDLVGRRFGVDKDAVLFVSSNGWDAGCATAYGFETVWANRGGHPVDRLPGRPAHVLPDLSRLPELVS
ncbi:(S)-2-haloacid dehalogenase 4A [Roseivivax jejudonensis]|uniref:(S)-2-haloacid dehalogenase n=1 Tax=Roseivivax jejudonensis TaxID=1529041 RepID=A0A1X7A9R7_9RHOB|nr:haloacid dehalogenase type II [Roseivivax jejudonensis]SLN73698.1 (S)-2-haloacid dehalogenase 4A [Roseivivax jejudonensis]